MFNQSYNETDFACLVESTSGYYCSEWEQTTLTTHNYLHFLSLLLIPITIYIVIGFFIRKK
jgi:hypothetical protein